MKYYLLFPDQDKSSINYDKQMVADSNGFKTIYLKPQFKELTEALTVMEWEEFVERICDPEDLIIFDEKGNEYSLEEFSDDIKKKFDYVRNDF